MTNNIILKRDRVFLLSSILALFFLVGCEKQPELTFGSGFVTDNSGANVAIIDTATVKVETVYSDSTATAGTGFLQVGTYKDPYFGVINSRAFIQVGAPAVLPAISINEIYDSIGLVIFYKKGPYYGDTTQPDNITVRQVTAPYQLNDFQNGFFSNSSLPVDPTPLGSTNILIGPNVPFTSQQTGDTIRVPLDKNLGQTLFTMAYNNSDTLKNEGLFLQWFHGLCLSSEGFDSTHSQGIMYGFQDSMLMRVYYHQAADQAIQKFMDFGITNKGFQFNNITAIRKNYPVGGVNTSVAVGQSPPATPSDSSSHMGFVQTSTGMNVKVSFPWLYTVPSRLDYLSVLRATLTVRLVPGSWNTTWTLPPQIGISTTDIHNLIGAPLPSSATGQAQTGNPVLDYIDVANTFYTYDVTNFVKVQINNLDPTITKPGLMLSIPSSSSFARAVLADYTYPVNQRIQLKIYYISQYPHN